MNSTYPLFRSRTFRAGPFPLKSHSSGRCHRVLGGLPYKLPLQESPMQLRVLLFRLPGWEPPGRDWLGYGQYVGWVGKSHVVGSRTGGQVGGQVFQSVGSWVSMDALGSTREV